MRKFCDCIIHPISAAVSVDCTLLGENVCLGGFLSLSPSLSICIPPYSVLSSSGCGYLLSLKPFAGQE